MVQRETERKGVDMAEERGERERGEEGTLNIQKWKAGGINDRHRRTWRKEGRKGICGIVKEGSGKGEG